MKFEIKKYLTGEIQFTAEIDCEESESHSVKLGLAIKVAIKASANLYGANLRSANLYGANLYGADLRSADLRSANLYGADLRSANLYGANLYGADLYGANLYGANLYGADLYGANLYGADLRSANLYGADLRSANLYGANLASVKGLEKQPPETIILPEGDLIVYKKLVEGVAKLLVKKNTKRSNATGRKCRAEKATVLELPDGVKVGTSKHDGEFQYVKGKVVKSHEWSDDWAVECAGGIHFFLTRKEAEDY